MQRDGAPGSNNHLCLCQQFPSHRQGQSAACFDSYDACAVAQITTSLCADVKPASFQTDCLQVLNLFITMAEIVVTHSTAGESSDLHLTLHDALKLVWLPTHKDLVTGLRETTESSLQTQLKEAWIRLGEVVGLDLERERAEAKRDARRKETCCAWKDCRWHRVPPPNPPRVCKGCGEMRYCSKTCQTE